MSMMVVRMIGSSVRLNWLGGVVSRWLKLMLKLVLKVVFKWFWMVVLLLFCCILDNWDGNCG